MPHLCSNMLFCTSIPITSILKFYLHRIGQSVAVLRNLAREFYRQVQRPATLKCSLELVFVLGTTHLCWLYLCDRFLDSPCWQWSVN